MRKLLMGGLVGLTLVSAGCTQTDRATGTGALLGAGGGALIGGLTNGTKGAVIGGALGAGAGAIAGNVIGRSQAGDCIYRDQRTGERYVAACP